MDEERLGVKPAHVMTFRSPAFNRDEVYMLLDLIEKYKTIVLNKSTTAAVSHAKEVAWLKIAKTFNSQGFKHTRGAECLKTKWENLKRSTKKISKNLIDAKYDEFSDYSNRVVALMCEAEMSSNVVDVPPEIEEELKEALHEPKEDDSDKFPANNEYKQPSDSDDDNDVRISRSLNFSPQESRILLKCVKEEKKLVFSKENTGKAIDLKNRAWSKITEAFNKRSPQKRSTRVLRTKFNNMKRNAKCGYLRKYLKLNRHEKLDEEDCKEIKAEPSFGFKADSDAEIEGNNGDDDDDEDCVNDERPDSSSNHYPDHTPDPLSTVLSSDSGLGSTGFIGAYNFGKNEVTKLKMELLKYQLETAKLERQRVEEALKADSAAQKSIALERSLRLRAARLDAVAAEMKLPPNHPALRFNMEEACTQEYLNQYH